MSGRGMVVIGNMVAVKSKGLLVVVMVVGIIIVVLLG